jgi:hypothetical protein
LLYNIAECTDLLLTWTISRPTVYACGDGGNCSGTDPAATVVSPVVSPAGGVGQITAATVVVQITAATVVSPAATVVSPAGGVGQITAATVVSPAGGVGQITAATVVSPAGGVGRAHQSHTDSD